MGGKVPDADRWSGRVASAVATLGVTGRIVLSMKLFDAVHSLELLEARLLFLCNSCQKCIIRERLAAKRTFE